MSRTGLTFATRSPRPIGLPLGMIDIRAHNTAVEALASSPELSAQCQTMLREAPPTPGTDSGILDWILEAPDL